MGTSMLVQILAFATLVSIGSTANLPKTTGIYTFELCGGRSKCSKQAEFLGFNNMTCDHGVPPKAESYGNTVGPLLRETGGESHLWKWWNVTVTGTSAAGATMATIKNAFPKGKGKPNCLGYYMTDYYHYKNKKACKELPWAERVHLHAESRPWEFVPIPGTDCFNIVDDAKPKGCLRFLSASSSCSERYMHLTGADNGSGLQRWRLQPQPNSQPPSPKPVLKPPSPSVAVKAPPPPSAKPTAPLLLAVGASSTTSGSVVFQPTPGATSCTISLTAPGKSTTTSTITSLSYPQTSFYPVNLSPDVNYNVVLKCLLPGNKVISAPNPQVLHTPINNGQPTVINFVPTSSNSGNLTIIPPDPVFCKATSYVVKAIVSSGNGIPITINSTSTVVEVKGLTPGATYAIVVQAVCEGGRLTTPMDPLYLTPPKSSPSAPSPSPGKPPAPGGKAPPSPSPGKPPAPPALNECTEKPVLEVVAVSGSLVTVNVKAPPPISKSQVVIAVDCVDADGTETEADTGSWIPASDPITSLQVYVPLKAGSNVKCEVIAAVQQLGQVVPVLCPIEEGYFSLSAREVTPDIQVGRTTTSVAEITLGKPQIACSGLQYVVRARSVDPSGPSQVVTVDTLSAKLTGLPPGQYQVTVTGRCPDGTETPESQAVKLSIPCDTTKNLQQDPVNGKCVCQDGYQVVNKACVESTPCPNGTYRDAATNTCIKCTPVAGCANPLCTSATNSVCSQCAPGTYLTSGTCGPCKPVAGCAADSLTCSSGTSSACSKCLESSGFNPVPDRGVCVCKAGFTLDAATGTCKSSAGNCSPSQYYSNGCKECSDTLPGCSFALCTSATNAVCSTCNVGYYLAAGKCPSCVPPAGCSAVSSCSSSSPTDTVCSACASGYNLSNGQCVGCKPTPIALCLDPKCDGTCELCGPNSAVDASKRKCKCNPDFADFDRKAENGCETPVPPPSPIIPVTTAPDVSKPPDRLNPPVFYPQCYEKGTPFNFGPLPPGVDSKVYVVDRNTNPISSLVVPKGYKVTLYAGGTLNSAGSDVNNPLMPPVVITCNDYATIGNCLDPFYFTTQINPLTTLTQKLSGNVDFVKIEYSDSNCPVAVGTPRNCQECDPDVPQLCELVTRPVVCNPPINYCITDVDIKADGRKVVTRGCGNYDRCYTEWYQGTSDDDKCRGTLSSVQMLDFTCTFCCVEDNCNDTPNLRPEESTLLVIK